MAQRQIVVLTDDLDDTELKAGEGETVTFALDGVTYEIDLNKKNAKKLRDDIGSYIDKGRRVAGSRSGSRRSRSKSDVDPGTVRAWALANKVDVNQRGRIPASVIAQFKEAGN